MKKLAVIALFVIIATAMQGQTPKHKHRIWAHIGHGAAKAGRAVVWVALFPVELAASFLGGTL
jgi:hypothetical protein